MEVLEAINDLKREIKLLKANQKTVLNIEEASDYTNYSKDYIYRMTSMNKIPHNKPLGRKIYFLKEDLDSFLIGASR